MLSACGGDGGGGSSDGNAGDPGGRAGPNTRVGPVSSSAIRQEVQKASPLAIESWNAKSLITEQIRGIAHFALNVSSELSDESDLTPLILQDLESNLVAQCVHHAGILVRCEFKFLENERYP